MLIQNRSVEVFCGETRVKFFEKLSQFICVTSTVLRILYNLNRHLV